MDAGAVASSSKEPLTTGVKHNQGGGGGSSQQSHAEVGDGPEGSMAAGAVSDDSDDEVADFRMLLPQLASNSSRSAQTGALPKRGEKDFEPTGFRGQEKKLEESRRAMEMVIGQPRNVTR